MPTYEYECKSCGHGFEVFQSMSDPPLKECPECGKEIRRLIFGGTGVIFKGSGFYITDKNNGSVRAAGKNTGKHEDKTASASNINNAKSDSASKENSTGGEPSVERNSKNPSGAEFSHSERSDRTLNTGSEKTELKSKSA